MVRWSFVKDFTLYNFFSIVGKSHRLTERLSWLQDSSSNF